MLRLTFLISSVLAVSACGLFEPNVEECGDDCPGVRDGGDGGATGGGGGMGDTGATGGSAGVGGQGGSAGGSGGTGAGGQDGGSGGSTDAGDAGGNDGGGCEPCVAPRPYCATDECVECTQDAHCSSAVCENDECVACRRATDCPDRDAAHCTSDHTCAPCESSADCAHFDDAKICDAGKCVECTAADETKCSLDPEGVPYVCDVFERRCAGYTVQSAGLCDPCVSDAQCGSGQLCVMQRFDEVGDAEGEVDVGWFCFWREDADEAFAPAGSCANVPPFFATQPDRQSISGEEGTVCGLRVTTCAAYKDYSAQSCSGVDDDGACGDPRFASDGYCREAATETFLCTTPCGGPVDCKSGFECTGPEPTFCSL